MDLYNKHWPSMFKRSGYQNLQHGNSSKTGGHDEERTSQPPKPRWIPRPEQIKILEEIFNSGKMNPPREEIKKIRERLQEYGPIAEINIFYWFQNRKARKNKRTQPTNNMIPRKRRSKNSVAQTITPPLNSFSSSSSHHQNAFPNEMVVPNNIDFPTNNGVINLTNDSPNDTILGNQNLAADYFHTPNQTDFQLPTAPLYSCPSQFSDMTQQLPQNENFMNYANRIPMNDQYDQRNIQDPQLTQYDQYDSAVASEVAMNMMLLQQQHDLQLIGSGVTSNSLRLQQQQQQQHDPQLIGSGVTSNSLRLQQQQHDPQLIDSGVTSNSRRLQQQQHAPQLIGSGVTSNSRRLQHDPQLIGSGVTSNSLRLLQQHDPQLIGSGRLQQQQHDPQLISSGVTSNSLRMQQQQHDPQLIGSGRLQQQQHDPQLIGSGVTSNSLNDDSDLPPLPPIVIEAPVADDPFSNIPQFQGAGGAEKCTVSINNEIVEVDAGPFNIRQIFGDEAILFDSSGQLVLTDEWGVTLDSLQHGASYFLGNIQDPQLTQNDQYDSAVASEVAMNMMLLQQQHDPQLIGSGVTSNSPWLQQQQHDPQLIGSGVTSNSLRLQQQQHDPQLIGSGRLQQQQHDPQLIGSSVTSNSLNDDSDLPPLPPIVIEAPVADDPFSNIPQFQGAGEAEKCTVSINNEIVEVDAGPFNIRQIFGDEAILFDSSGQLVLTDEWGVTLDSLQHGASYFLI